MSEKMFTGTFYGTTREDEEKKLNIAKEMVEERLGKIRQSASDLQEELKSLREVYDVEDKEGLAQNALGVVFQDFAAGGLDVAGFVAACKQVCAQYYAS